MGYRCEYVFEYATVIRYGYEYVFGYGCEYVSEYRCEYVFVYSRAVFSTVE